VSFVRYGKAPLAAAVALLVLAATATPLALAHWDTWLATGKQLGTSKQADRFLRPERTGAPLVLAIGDSTMRPPIPFTKQMAVRIGPAVEVRTFWGAGLSPAEAALVASAALELEPAAMILLAHFATFEAPQPLRYPELVRIVPPRRLPALLPLPFSSRGLGAGEIVLGSVVGTILPKSWIRVSAGGAKSLQKQLEARWAVTPGTDYHRLARYGKLRLGAILRSVDKVYPGHPSVEMLRGAVHMIEDAGVEVLVVISPVNVAPLQEHGVFDAVDIERRVRHVSEVVESAGGEVLDMHDGLPPEEFADELGHYTTTGARRISLPVEDWTRRVLRLPPRRRR
jgi:hypothetical protein